jgi:hypothetical protein
VATSSVRPDDGRVISQEVLVLFFDAHSDVTVVVIPDVETHVDPKLDMESHFRMSFVVRLATEVKELFGWMAQISHPKHVPIGGPTRREGCDRFHDMR